MKLYRSNFLMYLFLSIFMLMEFACTSTLRNPKSESLEMELIGTWVADYGNGVKDTIHIHKDGIYQQLYENPNTGYRFQTDWEKWEIQTYSDGRVWLFLIGGRYYVAGERIAELDGQGDPCPASMPDCISGNHPRPFYDPYDTDYSVEMIDRLVLTVRSNSKGKVFLYHMWTTPDKGFSMFGQEDEIFYKEE